MHISEQEFDHTRFLYELKELRTGLSKFINLYEGFNRDSVWLKNNRDSLKRIYNGMFVFIYNESVVLRDSDFERFNRVLNDEISKGSYDYVNSFFKIVAYFPDDGKINQSSSI